MKKILTILSVFLLWSNTSFANPDYYVTCKKGTWVDERGPITFKFKKQNPGLKVTKANKEDYKDLIRPVPRIKREEFTYLSFDEVQNLPEEQRELYHEQRESQIHINPIFSVIHDEIIEEEERIYMIENDNSSENSYIDDY